MEYQPRVFSWLNPKLEVRKTAQYGSGIFAKERVLKNERLAIFGGYVLSLEEERNLPVEYQDTGVQIAENFVLTSKTQKEDTDCFNHSCEPNAGFKGQIFLVAMRDIELGEEICFDYAMALSGDEDYEMECMCGSEKCRQKVTTEDWKSAVLQKKYAGYFQHYLEEKINRIN